MIFRFSYDGIKTLAATAPTASTAATYQYQSKILNQICCCYISWNLWQVPNARVRFKTIKSAVVIYHETFDRHHLWRLVWRRVPCRNLRPNQLDKYDEHDYHSWWSWLIMMIVKTKMSVITITARPATTVHPRGAHDLCHPQPNHQHWICSWIQPGWKHKTILEIFHNHDNCWLCKAISQV